MLKTQRMRHQRKCAARLLPLSLGVALVYERDEGASARPGSQRAHDFSSASAQQMDEHLHLFEEGINRWIEIILGSASTATRQFHVTKLSVIQYFIIVTWNRAFCRGDSSLLTANLDIRWQA